MLHCCPPLLLLPSWVPPFLRSDPFSEAGWILCIRVAGAEVGALRLVTGPRNSPVFKACHSQCARDADQWARCTSPAYHRRKALSNLSEK
ncbi:hypothetical protein EDB81DRAFT_786353 [Dactylonectria macrodidyma]|uniref:Uncharacterized protein n=1 Tax=Dactylonectria macrodidyma TaxID=307937 RepID=A0A9P9JFL0_9HYPO|nr:hypothetical protein EDB81DRAFT_786353 [Dactylonectria macrodidyma]